MKKIRVGIADDNELSRQMLRAIAEMDTDLEIVGEAMSGVEALALVKSQKPDVMLLDVVMPLGDGLCQRVKKPPKLTIKQARM